MTTSERIALVQQANLLREALRLIGKALLEQDRELAIAVTRDVANGARDALDAFGAMS